MKRGFYAAYTLHPGEIVVAYEVTFTSDGTTEDFEEAEIRKLLVIDDRDSRKTLIEGLKKGFDYLEDRLTGNCQAHYDCSANGVIPSA